MEKPHLSTIVEELERRGLLDSNGLQGCSVAEISALEKAYNIKLPETYVQFLLKMGTLLAASLIAMMSS